MVKTILYCVSGLEQKRVFQCIDDYSNKDVRQLFIGPVEKSISNSKFRVKEGYADFKIKEKILCSDKYKLRKLVHSIKPDIFVCGTAPNLKGISLPKKCKKVFVSHGIVGDHIYNIKSIRNKKFYNQWIGSDLYCGAGKNFERFLKTTPGFNPKSKILFNAIPQFDIIYNDRGNNSFKEALIKQNKIPKADKYILFAGFGGHKRSDFFPHNEDYYRTAIYLEKIAKKNNWFVFTKPRVPVKHDRKFVGDNDYISKYAKDYGNLWKSKYVCMVHPMESIYKYFFSDIIIVNGTSTLEVEACCVNKPLIMVRTDPNSFDPLKTVFLGGAKLVNSKAMNDLEDAINGSFKENISHYSKILEYHGISFDGKMSKRVGEAILKL
ncbi:hypothetical protein LCGC14_2401120 [marine sediment metagenome]|uniref:UDP-N-acetylglucosamine 2-epimerase domain-containing protein n=1 Tax=marine sediment metagenome TaxID=412755 RepID=A0A0F9BVB2_9ZZZZ